MDFQTINAYGARAQTFAEDWANQPVPTDLYTLLTQYFSTGKTADVGCGAGRDTAWLASKGFDVIGFDGSEALLREGRRRHPQLDLKMSLLPKLEGVPRNTFQNVLCETVIMHLPPDEIGDALAQLLQLLLPGGVLALSWRTSNAGSQRDEYGRLYAAVNDAEVHASMSGHNILMDTKVVNLSSKKEIRRLVVRKCPTVML